MDGDDAERPRARAAARPTSARPTAELQLLGRGEGAVRHDPHQRPAAGAAASRRSSRSSRTSSTSPRPGSTPVPARQRPYLDQLRAGPRGGRVRRSRTGRGADRAGRPCAPSGTTSPPPSVRATRPGRLRAARRVGARASTCPRTSATTWLTQGRAQPRDLASGTLRPPPLACPPGDRAPSALRLDAARRHRGRRPAFPTTASPGEHLRGIGHGEQLHRPGHGRGPRHRQHAGLRPRQGRAARRAQRRRAERHAPARSSPSATRPSG